LIQETVQAPDQLATDQPQKKPAQPQKKAKQPASTNEKAHAKRDREAPRTPAGARVSKPAVPKQAPDAGSQKALEAAPAAVASPRADEQPLNDGSRGGSLLATAGTAWPVSPITDSAAGTPAATNVNTADAASNAVQVVDPNEINELDRAAIVESSWVNYLLWMLGAALAAAFAMWFFSRMRFPFGRRILGANVSGVTRVLLLLRLQLNKYLGIPADLTKHPDVTHLPIMGSPIGPTMEDIASLTGRKFVAEKY
jgi:hypothetical protein